MIRTHSADVGVCATAFTPASQPVIDDVVQSYALGLAEAI